jgi:GntR family transcriptional regulator
MILLDYKSRQPIYEQLYNSFAKMAALHVMHGGEQLPSVRALAQSLGINPNTVQKAYQLLERDGIIYSIPGKGSFIGETTRLERERLEAAEELKKSVVKAQNVSLTPDEIRGIVEEALKGGISP